MKQEFVCPQCHCMHVREQQVVDEFISCRCGFEFYAFGNEGMSVEMPSREMGESVRNALRRLVQTSGRCRDAHPPQPETVDFKTMLRRMDPVVLMEIALEEYQQETFGKQMVHSDDVVNIMEIVNEKKDAVVKGQNGYVNVMEQKVRSRKAQEVNYVRLIEDGLAALPNGQITFLQEAPLRQWQIDIMERDAAGTGELFGDAG